MKRLFLLIITLMSINSRNALAGQLTRNVYAQDAQGIDLSVYPGYGLTINFIPTGENIKQVWIGDPSRIVFTSNGKLCSKMQQQDCPNENADASVLFIRQIKPIQFKNMISSSDGSTQITVITNGSQGEKQYQFRLIPASGQPSYTSIIIKPDSEKPAPLIFREHSEHHK